MKTHALALALMLCACTPAEEANNVAADASDAPLQNGAQQPQPVNGQAAHEQPGDISLTASPESVRQGGTITLTLANRTTELLGYNLCTSSIETGAGATVPTDRVCTMELRTLEAGNSVPYSYDLPAEVAPGRYRLSTRVQGLDSGRQETLRTGIFEITAG